RGCDIVPTIYAHALPGGAVIKSDFLRLANSIVDKLTPDLDGVWLYLHGAMCVENLGSAEEALLKMVRDKIGYDIPVSVAMDFHADNSDEIPRLANCVTGYRTAPHCDREETERRAMELLFYMIDNKILPRPQIARANVIICGDAVQTALSPMKDIMEAAAELEKLPGMLSVQVFNGQPWIDEEYTGPNFVVTHENDELLAKECAEKLAKMFYDKRHDFEFLVEALEPKEALLRADSAKESTVFVSDSGDNTTAGAAGDNAYMLNLMQKLGLKNALLAGIMDADACDACYKAKIGDTLTLTVGGSLSEKSEKATITGKLIHRGDILSYQYNNAGPSATLDCGDITVVITKNRAALCRPDIFESINLDYNKFHVVVVKLGYLFPELAAEAERAILAFTPGASTERLQDMGLTKIRRPMFPLDDNFI
ncbi:MAG: M81 family metallopeptidase, partial [Clostridia bacterium]|nr:M81 family metallopeptidase [Clostridia bacterium]